MSFTYTDTLLTSRDLVRCMIGDTVSANARFTDEELNALLVKFTAVEEATGWACRILGHDVDRCVMAFEASFGGVTLRQMMSRYARFGDKWLEQ